MRWEYLLVIYITVTRNSKLFYIYKQYISWYVRYSVRPLFGSDIDLPACWLLYKNHNHIITASVGDWNVAGRQWEQYL